MERPGPNQCAGQKQARPRDRASSHRQTQKRSDRRHPPHLSQRLHTISGIRPNRRCRPRRNRRARHRVLTPGIAHLTLSSRPMQSHKSKSQFARCRIASAMPILPIRCATPTSANVTPNSKPVRSTLSKHLAVFILAPGLLLHPSQARSTDSAPATAPLPGHPLVCTAGDLQASFQIAPDGLHLAKLIDLSTATTLATGSLPLFTLVLRQPGSNADLNISATSGWQQVSHTNSPLAIVFAFANHTNPALEGLYVRITLQNNSNSSAFHWNLDVHNKTKAALRQIVFPQLGLADPGEQSSVLFPRGPGEVQRGVWRKDFRYRGDYPGGWCAMQFVAAYRTGDKPTGLYVGFHDPFGSTKYIDIKSEPANRELQLKFEVPAPNFNSPGNSFSNDGRVVWQLLRGDWFDAATIYRQWASNEAKWWPTVGPDGRSDTPMWMRQLNAWVMTGGAPTDCLAPVRTFRNLIGLPVGFHWYNWHQIPFDNDYPHYFPTKPDFADAVAALQQEEVFVMPYINGRLWDSHDRGSEDFQFSSVALPAATKMENGQPFLESYGSKETNGQPVRLAVMCPTTKLWQDKVSEIVLNLLKQQGTRAVYIDQIAAAPPTLCSDKSHDHPAGGGHWWNEGYWTMLDRIRSTMPPNTALTTECNGEPFIRWMDGYLTWHWQHDGQVPVFPAVYGGTIQMFGRAYRAGPTKDLALRMKAAQQLVFGEQIGWFDPAQASEPQNLTFLKKIISTRAVFQRYFYAGQMDRPPKLQGQIPTLRADWQWSGEWWVTTDAVLTGAWRIPGEKRAVLLFANPGDQPVTATLQIKPGSYGLAPGIARLKTTRDGIPSQSISETAIPIEQHVEFPAQSVIAWELF